MTITDPKLPPKERLQMLEAIAMGLSPMHPNTFATIKAEWLEVQQLLDDPPVEI